MVLFERHENQKSQGENVRMKPNLALDNVVVVFILIEFVHVQGSFKKHLLHSDVKITLKSVHKFIKYSRLWKICDHIYNYIYIYIILLLFKHHIILVHHACI